MGDLDAFIPELEAVGVRVVDGVPYYGEVRCCYAKGHSNTSRFGTVTVYVVSTHLVTIARFPDNTTRFWTYVHEVLTHAT